MPVDALAPRVATLPAAADARRALLDAVDRHASARELVEHAEQAPALAVALLRAAPARSRARSCESLRDAIATLSRTSLRDAILTTPTYRPLEPAAGWGDLPERFEVHALAVTRATGLICARAAPELAAPGATLALAHDIGRVALEVAVPRDRIDRGFSSPEQRLAAERRLLGTDHARLGGALCRSWGLPALADAVEAHHSARAGIAAVVRLADMVVHHAYGQPVDVSAVLSVGAGVGLARADLVAVVESFRRGDVAGRSADCPLSEREVEILELLADGMVPKQVAQALALAPSTVRNHLHRIYARIGVADRSQALLLASRHGWIERSAAHARRPSLTVLTGPS